MGNHVGTKPASPLLVALPGLHAAMLKPARHFVITGGGGWLGSAALDCLDSVYGAALPGRVAVFGAGARQLQLRSGRCIASRPFADMAVLDKPGPTILHFAYLTRGYAAQMSLDDYLGVNRNLSAAVARMAARCGAAGLFIPSSGAVYRRDRTLDQDITANPYGVLKLEDEDRFGDLAHRHGFPAVIARIFNLSGPFMNHVSHYALGSILRDIGAARPIVLKASHPVIRGYTHVGDLLSLAVSLLLRGQGAAPFDISGVPAIEIGDLARRAAALLGQAELAIDRPAFESGEPDIYVGDAARFAALADVAGLKPRGLDQQILDTAAYLQETA